MTSIALFVSIVCFSQTFTEQTTISLIGVENSSVNWGDYDNDGDLDILISGNGRKDLYNTIPVTRIYRNNGDNSFSEQTGIVSIEKEGAAAWGDYDNDGYLDIISTGPGNTSIYHNNGDNSFTEQTVISLTGIENNSKPWGDYDNDGDLDILGVTKIFRNNGGNSFTEQDNCSYKEDNTGSLVWGDYDNDGDLDFLLTGKSISTIYRNDGNSSFTAQSEILLKGFNNGTVTWGDYDNDGDLDLLMAGNNYWTNIPKITTIYRNNGYIGFTEQTDISLTGIENGSVAWGDYDNDGDLDILVSGSGISKLYRNNGDNSFTEQTDIMLKGLKNCSVAWGDYDNDGDLDILLAGFNGSTNITTIYRNDETLVNKSPDAPIILQQTVSGTDVVLTWKSVSTDETPTKAISYNVKVVRQSNSVTVTSPHAANNGYRKIAAMGNAQLDTVFTVKNLEKGVYTWCVQAIDNSFKGGAFSTEGTFTISASVQTDGLTVSNIQGSSALVKWNRGNLAKCVVFMKEGAGSILPVNHTTYIASAIFGQGTNAADGWFCVYNGVGDNVAISGLKGRTNYSVQALEYDGLVGSEVYLSSVVADNKENFTTPPFTKKDISTSSNTVQTVNCGDFDNDGDLDNLATGKSDSNSTNIYRNDGNFSFTNLTGISLTQIGLGAANWGDYDNDGDLDILLTGHGYNILPQSKSYDVIEIYRNNGNSSFTKSITFPVGFFNSAIWADFDNDDDLDILLISLRVSRYYCNNGDNSYTELSNMSTEGAIDANVACGDYDNDGFLDILLTGSNGSTNITKIYRNDEGKSFTEQTAISLTGVSDGSAAFGDYDKDGNLDILLTGSGIAKIYRNNGNNSFTEQTNISLNGVSKSSAAWGDYDNDGDLDIILTGLNGVTNISKIYTNNGNNSFTEQTDFLLTGISSGSVIWADYDNDGDLDLYINGKTETGTISSIYINNLTNVKEIADNAPTRLVHTILGSDVILNWKPVITDVLPAKALSYNVSVYMGIDSCVTPSNSLNNGIRKVVTMGNAQADTTFTLKNIHSGTYYWKVQSIDNAYQGGAFSIIDSFSIKNSVQAHSLLASNIDGSSAVLHWVRGNYNKCVVFIKEGFGNAKPLNNSTYSASALFGQGTTAGDGWYCVYNGIGDNVTVSGLNGLTNYSVQVFEFDGVEGFEHYLTTTAIENPYKFKTFNFSKQSSNSLKEFAFGSSAWGDYDNDGYLDILITGTAGKGAESKIYRNNGNNTFSEQSNIMLTGVEYSSVAWGDYDNDGNLDILLTGATEGEKAVSKIFRNNGDNSFKEQTTISLTGVYNGSVAWGDYDNDGDLDILLTGRIGDNMYISKIYRNNGTNSFTEQTAITLPNVGYSSVAWGDYDNDGDLDILLAGNSGLNIISKIYKNDGNNRFTEQTGISLTGVYYSSVSWGDYDNDGDLDILLTGAPDYGYQTSKIYRNNGNDNFSEQTDILLKGVESSAVAWGDYDNDGDLDILLTGYSRGKISKIYTNDGNNNFTEQTDISILGSQFGSATWGDYDNDGDLDILLNGTIYRNFITNKGQEQKPNEKPLSPKHLTSVRNGDTITLSWEGDASDETPVKTLSYNIAIGRTKDSLFVGATHGFDAIRTVVSMGNTDLNNFYTIKVDSEAYYWTVQAVDGGFRGGDWAPIDSFNIQSSIIDPLNIDYTIFPNPVYDILTITSTNVIDSKICIYTLNGELLKTESMTDKIKHINIQSLPKGIYMLRIFNDKKSVAKKIVKLN